MAKSIFLLQYTDLQIHTTKCPASQQIDWPSVSFILVGKKTYFEIFFTNATAAL